MTLQYPTATEAVTWFYNSASATLTTVYNVVRGVSPSVTYNIKWAATRDAASAITSAFTADTTVTSTAGASPTPNNTTIAAGYYVWLETSAAAAGTTEFHVTIRTV
jgi:hypothetical protein